MEQIKKDEWVNEGMQPLFVDIGMQHNLMSGIRNQTISPKSSTSLRGPKLKN
jgi:hypothetical protein